MIFNQAEFDSLESIPNAYPSTSPRDEFELVNGKWRLKVDAIPGAADLLNPGIAANRDRALDQVKAKNTEIANLNSQISTLQNQSQVPAGSVVLNGEDAKTWKKVTDLVSKAGSVKEIETAVTEYPVLKTQIEQGKTAETLKTLATDLGLNGEVLVDWANHPTDGKGLTFFTKDGVIQDPENPKNNLPVKIGYVKIEKEVNGKTEVSEQPLTDFAKTTLPLWKYTALTTVSDGGRDGEEGEGQETQHPAAQVFGQQPAINTARPIIGTRLPNTSSVGNTTGKKKGEKTSLSEMKAGFQKERDSIPSPFDPPASAAAAK